VSIIESNKNPLGDCVSHLGQTVDNIIRESHHSLTASTERPCAIYSDTNGTKNHIGLIARNDIFLLETRTTVVIV